MQDPWQSEAVKSLLKQSTAAAGVAVVGSYTKPPTWGVYEIEPLSERRATRRIRIGNHPIRQRELEKEFGAVRLRALFTSRTLAEDLAWLVNGRKRSG